MTTSEETAASILKQVFAAFDGDDPGILYAYGVTARGNEVTIGGIMAFVSEWDTNPEPPFLGISWEAMSNEQRFERAKWSAQHALIKRLADLRKEAEGIGAL
jgi:DNA primase